MRNLSEDEELKAVEYIKFKLREDKWPFYSDEQIGLLLENNLNDKNLAVYEGLIAKSRVDSIKLPGGLEKPSNREYWLSLGSEMRAKISAAINAGAYNDILEGMKMAGLLDTFVKSKRGGFYSMARIDES